MAEPRHAWLPVARWELFRLLRRPDVILSILVTPALVFGVSLLMSAFDHPGDRKVAVVRADASGAVIARGATALPPLQGYVWLDPGAAGADTMELASQVRARAFEAALVVRADDHGRWTAHLITRREPPRWAHELREHVQTQARAERARALGLNPTQLAMLDEPINFRSGTAFGGSSGNRRGDFLLTFGLLMLMIAVLVTSMSYLMVGISGEKQSRVTEVVVSAIPAQSWMDGKIVAFTAVGLLTGIVWAGALLVLAAPFAFQLPSSINPVTLGVAAWFSIFGLYFFNAMIAALMASAQNMQSASKWQGNFLLIPFIPVFFLGALLENPDSTTMVVVSQIPIFTSVMIPVRLAMGAAQLWEVVLGAVVLLVSCWFMRIVAGRIFRLGMLLYGKDMTLPELIRWARVK